MRAFPHALVVWSPPACGTVPMVLMQDGGLCRMLCNKQAETGTTTQRQGVYARAAVAGTHAMDALHQHAAVGMQLRAQTQLMRDRVVALFDLHASASLIRCPFCISLQMCRLASGSCAGAVAAEMVEQRLS